MTIEVLVVGKEEEICGVIAVKAENVFEKVGSLFVVLKAGEMEGAEAKSGEVVTAVGLRNIRKNTDSELSVVVLCEDVSCAGVECWVTWMVSEKFAVGFQSGLVFFTCLCECLPVGGFECWRRCRGFLNVEDWCAVRDIVTTTASCATSIRAESIVIPC